MTAVILAAGIASRLRPLTDNTPKCLLALGGKTILQRTVDNLLANGITRFVFVTGYLREQIERFVAAQWSGIEALFIHNDVYASTNNIYSLWLAKDAVGDDDMLLLDSDILFDQRIVAALLSSPRPDCIALNTAIEVGEEEIKVRLGSDGRIEEISKVVAIEEAVGESIGIERFSADFAAQLYRVLERMIVAEHRVGIFYEAAFEEVIREGRALYAVDISAFPCIELDTVDDFHRAEREILPLLAQD